MAWQLLSILFGATLTVGSAYAWGVALLWGTPAPVEIALGLGAIGESFLIFLALVGRHGVRGVFLAIALAPLLVLYWVPRTRLASAAKVPFHRAERWAAIAIFGAFGLWYAANALAPETTPDGMSYHLALPAAYMRLRHFPKRFAFYDLLPQGVEMMFTMAFAFGRHSAAKLVDFAFFLATPFLIMRVGRRLEMSDTASMVAAAGYFCAPLAGLTGASSYTDGALVFFTLAAFYCLLVWRETRVTAYAFVAGLAAGFCYAIKMPGAVAVAGAAAFVVAAGVLRHRSGTPRNVPPQTGPGTPRDIPVQTGSGTPRDVPLKARPLTEPRASASDRPTPWLLALLAVTAGAALAMAPWLLRSFLLTGDPFAPLGNALFPNRYFHLAMEKALSAGLSALPVPLWRVPWELAFGGQLTGAYGPLVFALPLGLLAWRTRAGRLCLAAALLLAAPWLFNKGARFLMPSFVFGALAVGAALDAILPVLWARRAAWALIAVQAIFSWPQVLDIVHPAWTFRLQGFPWRAALRIESDDHYLRRVSPVYETARLLERLTPPDARIFDIAQPGTAYLAREVTVSWQSAEGDWITDTLRLCFNSLRDPFYNWTFAWPMAEVTAIRFRMPQSYTGEWDIDEAQFYAGDVRLANQPGWKLRAYPNVWETPLAFDDFRSTRWRTWQDVRAGMYFEVEFDRAEHIDSAVLLSHTPLLGVPIECYGRDAEGHWRRLSNAPAARLRPFQDFRREAGRALRRAGFSYVVASGGPTGDGVMADEMAAEPEQWGMELVGRGRWEVVLRVK